MKRRNAADVNKRNKELNSRVDKSPKDVSELGNKLLKDDDLTLENVEELGKIIAEKYNYDKQQLIVCNLVDLNGKLRENNENPVFFICNDHNNHKVSFCIVNHEGRIVCLYKDISNNSSLAKNVKTILENNLSKNVDFKINKDTVKNVNQQNLDVLCMITLETMMSCMKSDEKDQFIESFTNPKKALFQKLKDGAKYLFSFVNDNYYALIASDIDKLSKDTEFKSEIKKFIDGIPMIEEVKVFNNYQNLLKQLAEKDENDLDNPDDIVKALLLDIEKAKNLALGKFAEISFDVIQTSLSNLQNVFPNQLKKFTQIFEPLAKSKVDNELQARLTEICTKLDLDYDKLKLFFNLPDVTIENDDDHETPRIENIENVIKSLPKIESKTNDPQGHKTFEQLLSEITIEQSKSLSLNHLEKAYDKVKESSKKWTNKSPIEIYNWSTRKKGKLMDSEIYKAIAVLDRANELTTGGHKLRDTQILSILTFLQQNDKGQLTQIQTGEGKTTIVAIIAAIKVLKGLKVDVVTSNSVLASEGAKNKTSFYNLLNLSVDVNNLDPTYKSGPRMCYNADVVYGCISNFQFDYLKDSFLGLYTRANRPFDCIILDEVDSMIIDNASHIAKLSEALPGMESFKYVYIKIWQELHKAERTIVSEFSEKLKVKAREIRDLSLTEDKSQSLYEEYQNELETSIIQTLKDSIIQSEPTKINLIPSHLREYAENSLDRWIMSALDAKFVYQEDEQYVIRESNDEKIIQPVDYANTGMTLKNTIWQYGLHQFLQLKHNLLVTSENLTSCFISNLGYINKYGNQIFGLTGTLGSDAEQALLSSIYNVGYAKIPTYKQKMFKEIDGLIIQDDKFNSRIAEDALMKIQEDRAVLIICETIKDAKGIRDELTKLNIEAKIYFDEENAKVTEDEIDCGDVVIATNIAGRGTDFKTSDELEDEGGLHVCVAFLPCNKRVEDQAFGRTARQGKHGSAQLVVKNSQIDKLIVVNSNDFGVIKEARDERESQRIELIRDVKIPELEFQDQLFGEFAELYGKLKDGFGSEIEHKFVLDDLKEFWSFWLNNQKYEGDELADKSVDDEFSKFQSEAKEIIRGEIQFNPYHSIKQAEYFLSSNEKLNDAEKSLNHALDISKNPEILHSAYMKYFEISIERGWVFITKCRQALKDVFYIPMIEPEREYKQIASGYLEKAIKSYQIELDCIKNLFSDKDFPLILQNDIDERENLFIKHLISKEQALSLEIQRADGLIKQISTTNAGFSIGCRIPDYICNLKPKDANEQLIKDTILTAELSELAANSSNITYVLKAVYDVCPEIVFAAKVQIGGGIGLISMGILFPPALPITSSIGGTMINEGLCDVAIELINQNLDGKFDKKAYIKGKVISYGISLLTMGINAALQCPKILEKAKNACRWMAETLRKCPIMLGACEFLAKQFDKLGDWFQMMETIAKYNSMTKWEKLKYLTECNDVTELSHLGDQINEYYDLLRELQELGRLDELTHFQQCISTLGQVAINAVTTVVTRSVKHVIMSKIVTPMVESMMIGLKPIIKMHVLKSVHENIEKHKLPYNSFEDLRIIIVDIKNSIDFTTLRDIFKDTILGLTKHCSNWRVQLGALMLDQLTCWKEIYDYAASICQKINVRLKSNGEIRSEQDEITSQLVNLLTDEIYSLIVSATITTCNDIYTIGKSSYKNYKREARELDECLMMNDNFREGGEAGQEQIRALSDVINNPIVIHDENGEIIVEIGQHNHGNPIHVSYFPADENNPSGHYVPFGENRDWRLDFNDDHDNNNCVFNAVAWQIDSEGDTLRQRTLRQIESIPRSYIAPRVREVLGNRVFFEGGRSNQPIHDEYYPSCKFRIKVAFDQAKIHADLRNSLNDEMMNCQRFEEKRDSDKLREMKCSKSMPKFGAIPDKYEMMMGTLYVRFNDGSILKLITVSGDKPFFVRQSLIDNKDLSFNAEPIAYQWNNDGFVFVDSGRPEGYVYDVYNRRMTNLEYSTCCASQKLFCYVGEHMKKNPNLEIDGMIEMAESWYRPGNGKYTPNQVIINKSCSHCESVLPAATGKNFEKK